MSSCSTVTSGHLGARVLGLRAHRERVATRFASLLHDGPLARPHLFGCSCAICGLDMDYQGKREHNGDSETILVRDV